MTHAEKAKELRALAERLYEEPVEYFKEAQLELTTLADFLDGLDDTVTIKPDTSKGNYVKFFGQTGEVVLDGIFEVVA